MESHTIGFLWAALIAGLSGLGGWILAVSVQMSRNTEAIKHGESTRVIIVDDLRRELVTVKGDINALGAKVSDRIFRCADHSNQLGRLVESVANLQKDMTELKKDFRVMLRRHGESEVD